MNNKEALRKIYYNINKGQMYGKQKNWGFDTNLSLTYNNNIYWCNYGSSCNKNTLKDLDWIIRTIFKTTPTQFLKDYQLK